MSIQEKCKIEARVLAETDALSEAIEKLTDKLSRRNEQLKRKNFESKAREEIELAVEGLKTLKYTFFDICDQMINSYVYEAQNE